MVFPRITGLAVASSLLFSPSFMFADYTYQETTQITGGSMVNMIKTAGASVPRPEKPANPSCRPYT